MGSRADLKFEGGTLTGELAKFDKIIAALQEDLDQTTDADEREKLAESIKSRIEVEHPFNQLWNELDPLSWKMTEIRIAMFPRQWFLLTYKFLPSRHQ